MDALATAADALLALASAAITAAVPIIVPVLLKRMHIADNANLNAKLQAALNAAAGAAYKYAAEHEGGLQSLAVHSGAMNTGVEYVASHIPDTLKALGLTPEHVHDMVAARLGALLASDPTVTAGKPTSPTVQLQG